MCTLPFPHPRTYVIKEGPFPNPLSPCFVAPSAFLRKQVNLTLHLYCTKPNVATAQPNAVWERMYIFLGPLHCNAQEIKDVMYHSFRLLTGKTAVSEVVTEFMTHNVAQTTQSDRELHNDTIKDIRALARGDAPTISGISRVVVNRLRCQRLGEPGREEDHYEADVSDPE